MTKYERQTVVLAKFVMDDFELSKTERQQEADALAQALQQTIAQCTENLEHRRRATR